MQIYNGFVFCCKPVGIFLEKSNRSPEGVLLTLVSLHFAQYGVNLTQSAWFSYLEELVERFFCYELPHCTCLDTRMHCVCRLAKLQQSSRSSCWKEPFMYELTMEAGSTAFQSSPRECKGLEKPVGFVMIVWGVRRYVRNAHITWPLHTSKVWVWHRGLET